MNTEKHSPVSRPYYPTSFRETWPPLRCAEVQELLTECRTYIKEEGLLVDGRKGGEEVGLAKAAQISRVQKTLALILAGQEQLTAPFCMNALT